MQGFEAWKEAIHPRLGREPIWQFPGYQKSLFLYELIWKDTESWKDNFGREKGLIWQIIRSAGSISANLEEGFGRGYGKEMLYFYRVALASARETKGWVYRAKAYYSAERLKKRLELCDEVIANLVTELTWQRKKTTIDSLTR